MYHRRMNGIRTTYAGDARRQQQEYRLHKYVFRNARVRKVEQEGTRPEGAPQVYLVDCSLRSPTAPLPVIQVEKLRGHPVQAVRDALDMFRATQTR